MSTDLRHRMGRIPFQYLAAKKRVKRVDCLVIRPVWIEMPLWAQDEVSNVNTAKSEPMSPHSTMSPPKLHTFQGGHHSTWAAIEDPVL